MPLKVKEILCLRPNLQFTENIGDNEVKLHQDAHAHCFLKMKHSARKLTRIIYSNRKIWEIVLDEK